MFVPADGYFVRFLEVLENLTDAPAYCDLQVQSHFSFTTEGAGDILMKHRSAAAGDDGERGWFVLVGAALGAGAIGGRWMTMRRCGSV
ncbi:MAG: hypothetical protein R3F65_14450 [bacterium]